MTIWGKERRKTVDLTETSTAAMDDLSSGAPTADWTSATKAAAPPPGPWRRLRCDGGWGVVTASTGNREIGGAPAASPKGSAGAAGPPFLHRHYPGCRGRALRLSLDGGRRRRFFS
ncbi:hypothetical protein ZWY2020_043951 [Hordeum vulgare]|nr:hypothetical protein ZWY2020_043951 [Hordeum vulgare]